MTINRTFHIPGLGECSMHIELSNEELRAAYDESQRNYRLEDIRNHLNEIAEEDLSGFALEEVLENPKLMGKILESFFRHESCELAENDVMDECIRTVLAEQGSTRKAAY